MSEYNFLLAIAGVLFVGAMSPGPSFMVVARMSLSQSRAHGIATAFGTGFGVSIFAVLASFGVTTLLQKVPSAFLVFKILGGLYLLYLAWRIWQGASQPLLTEPDSDKTSISLYNAFSQGLITQVSNPKTALVIAGVFAAFIPVIPPENTAWYVAIIAFVIDFFWYALVALSLSTKRSRAVYQRAKSGFDRTAALFLAAVSVRLIFF